MCARAHTNDRMDSCKKKEKKRSTTAAAAAAATAKIDHLVGARRECVAPHLFLKPKIIFTFRRRRRRRHRHHLFSWVKPREFSNQKAKHVCARTASVDERTRIGKFTRIQWTPTRTLTLVHRRQNTANTQRRRRQANEEEKKNCSKNEYCLRARAERAWGRHTVVKILLFSFQFFGLRSGHRRQWIAARLQSLRSHYIFHFFVFRISTQFNVNNSLADTWKLVEISRKQKEN